MNAAILGLFFGLWATAPDVDTAIERALAAEERGDVATAAANYQWAAANDAQLSRFLRYRALRVLLTMPSPPSARIDALAQGAAAWGYAGSALAAVEADARRSGGLPDAVVLRVALDTDDHDSVCEVLTQALAERIDEGVDVPAELVDIHHGECSDTEVPSFAARVGHQPTAPARVRRADRLYGQVRFTAAAEELAALGNIDELQPESVRCDAWFRLGRTMYRLRKRRAESEPAFVRVADRCLGKPERGIRRKALYAVGKRRYELDDFDAARKRFETLLADFPDTSHADDAVFYLARIARAQKDRKREEDLLALGAERYADGDMFGELVWEVLETYYRAGQWQRFVDAVDAVPRPEHDGMYYSQGRLEYFTAQALMKLKRPGDAQARWSAAWEKYPWSFYGYLSRMRLAESGGTPSEPQVMPDAVPPWLQSSGWRLGPLGRLSAFGPDLAAEFAAAYHPHSDEGRWQRAWVYDRAGRYDVSHNIVRRTIDGRPWTEPIEARLVQWTLAWPDPFGKVVDDAVAAEAKQAGSALLNPALPRAIMREESSFIEDIESYAGALGLMQLMPRTALGHDDDIEGTATPDKLKTAAVNVRVGADHLFWLARHFDGHPVLMVAAYNAGAGAVGKWLKAFGGEDIALFIEDIPALQTRDYTKRVIGSYAAYQWLTGGRGKLDDRVLRAPK